MAGELKGRVMGVDPGSKRVGLSLSDAMQVTARPLGFADAACAADEVARLAGVHEAVEVVVGLPYNMDGSKGGSAEAAERFAAEIRERTGLPVALWDERLTTAEASRLLRGSGMSRARKKAKIDGLAAQIMLQSFLDARAACGGTGGA